jgi:heterotetrameric sarcosine oxidase gamma subunit
MSGGRYRAQVTDLPMMALFEARGRQPALMAALAAAGLPWPQASGVMRFGPARVLVTAELAREAELDRMLEAAFASQPDADVALVSDMFRGFRISGAGAEDVLRQGAPLDLSRAVLPDGSAAATELWAVSAIISREAAAEPAFTEPAFTVLVDHSHAGYIADWLSAANGGAPLASPGVMTNPPPAISA